MNTHTHTFFPLYMDNTLLSYWAPTQTTTATESSPLVTPLHKDKDDDWLACAQCTRCHVIMARGTWWVCARRHAMCQSCITRSRSQCHVCAARTFERNLAWEQLAFGLPTGDVRIACPWCTEELPLQHVCVGGVHHEECPVSRVL